MKFKYYITLSCFIILAACKKQIPLSGGTPTFNVDSSALSVKAGSPVAFKFTGDAGLISFYSGEVYHDYSFNNGRIVDAGAIKLSFLTAVDSGTQANQFAVMASSDFNGNYADVTSVKNATWLDITSRFTLSTIAAFVSSGTKDISDLIVPGKPLYIAFKYHTSPQTTAGVAKRWRVQNFSLTGDSPIGTLTIANSVNGGFRIVEQAQAVPSRSSVTSTVITLRANLFTPGNDPDTESWAVSAPFNVQKIDVGPDWAVGIKGMTDAQLGEYDYTYSKPGTYKAYFVASNTNIDETRSVVRMVNITVTP